MASTAKPTPVVRTFLTDAPIVTATAAAALVSRRTDAVAKLWRSLLDVHEPSELMAVQVDYWNQLVGDYQDAYAEGLSHLTAPAPASTQA